MEDPKQLERIIEGALFAASEPLTVDQLLELFVEEPKPEKASIRAVLQTLEDSYKERGIELKDLASGFQFQVKADLSKWIRRLWEERPARYSRALMETLALIAYRQPITRGEIEEIRGVSVSSPMMKTLMDRGWARIVGHKDVPGKPGLYATTKKFLDYFGLKSLDELPPLAEIRDLDKMSESLGTQLELMDKDLEATASQSVESVTENEDIIESDAEDIVASDAEEIVERDAEEIIEDDGK